MNIIAIANQKGGVGKTTTAVNLSASLAAAEKHVLLIDLDPQGNATVGYGLNIAKNETTIYESVVLGSSLKDCITKTDFEYLQIIPSDERLYGAELELAGLMSRESRLLDALENLSSKDYDFVLLDCPPGLGLLTVNALTAAKSVLIPLQAEFLAMRGLVKLENTINLVQKALNADLKIEGILLTLYQSQFEHTQAVENVVARYYGSHMYETKIRQCLALSEAHSFGQPAILHDISSSGAQDYLYLAAEVLRANNTRI